MAIKRVLYRNNTHTVACIMYYTLHAKIHVKDPFRTDPVIINTPCMILYIIIHYYDFSCMYNINIIDTHLRRGPRVTSRVWLHVASIPDPRLICKWITRRKQG